MRVSAIVVALAWAAGARAQAPVEHSGRGIYYFDSAQRCPLAGVGSRGERACNRAALDDEHSKITIDAARHRIVVENRHAYKKKQLVGDLLFLGTGATADGRKLPIGVHLKIEKGAGAPRGHVHLHTSAREPLVSAELDPFEVTISDGTESTVALTPASALEAVRQPTLAARLANALVEVKDNLAGVTQTRAQPGFRASDLSIGLGLGALSKMVLRTTLVLPDGAKEPTTVAELFARGTWELRLTSLSNHLPKDVVARDLFLVGLDGVALLDGVRKAGLKKGETLTFRMQGGKGTLSVGGASVELPSAVDVARAFLEFSFIGAILARQAAGALG
jgi:hypothetical protein